MLFWSLATAMLLLALSLLLPSLLGNSSRPQPSTHTSNLAVYRERFAELERKHANQLLDAEEFTRSSLALKRALLEDASVETDALSSTIPFSSVRPAWPTLVLLVLLLPFTALTLYTQLGDLKQTATSLQLGVANSATASSEGAMPHAIDGMVAQLANRLQQHPDDPQGWLMLGRSYVTLGRAAEATLAFAHAYQQLGPQSQLLADYAEALALANGDSMAGQPEQLATQALALEPTNQKALWLAGIAAQQNNDATAASQHWRKLLALLPADSAEAQTLAGYLASMETQPATQNPTQQTVVAEPSAALRVSVDLAPELAALAPPDAVVFIFARAASGPRMPLAVARHQARDLPITVLLDDSSAMTPELRLSRFNEVVVGARISLSGSANVSSGDLQGMSESLRSSTVHSVQLTINERVP